MLSPELCAILACPLDHGALIYLPSESLLYNPRLHRSYRIDDDIPVLLIEESIVVDDTEHARLMAIADAIVSKED
ncbi:MAG: Trm112 family protein [Ferrimicrobium sp.]